MSVVFKIIPKLPLHIGQLHQKLKPVENLVIEPRGSNVYYYYIDQESTRGVDITLEDDTIEIRNTFLSNHADYRLTNTLAEHILELTQGSIYNEDDQRITETPLIFNHVAHIHTINHTTTAKALCVAGEVFSIFGPKRKVHLDKSVFERFTDLDDEQKQSYQMMDLIKKVNYGLPDYAYGDVLQATMDGEEKTMKVLTNSAHCIIDYYDYILLHRAEQNPIMITNQTLNQILPNEWELVDAHNIVAPIIPEASWLKLLEQAKPMDMWEEVMGD